MVGSRDSVAAPNVVLNTIVAEVFQEVCDELETAEDFDMKVHDLIKRFASEHQRIVFNGNGYSDEWVEEAERRGLPNIRTTVESIKYLTTDKTVELFEKFGVFTRAELESRAEIKYETYAKAINIEARAMIDIASKHIIPAVIKYITSLANSINQVREACEGVGVDVQEELLKESSQLLSKTRSALKNLIIVTDEACKIPEGSQQAEFFKDKVVTEMQELREPVDALEMIVNYETYAKAINIEARAMIDIASKHIIPAVIKYITSLANSINQVREACEGVGVDVQEELLKESSQLLSKTRSALKNLIIVTDEACKIPEGSQQAEFFKDKVVTEMQELREPVDALEMIVNKEMWPMPSYGDLLFEV